MTVDTVILVVAASLTIVGFGSWLRREQDHVLVRIILAGALAKLAGTTARYTFMRDLYDGVGDFNRYFAVGTQLAEQLRAGSLPDQIRMTGTPFMDLLVGVTYLLLPNQLWIGFAVFALLSFAGGLLFLQAFRLAVPDGNHRLYAALVFFTPTMVFWPSSLGKEAWLVFALGVATYGAARALTRARFGHAIAVVGATAVFVIRPHMATLFALSFVCAFLLRLRDVDSSRVTAGWLAGLLLLGAGAAFALANVTEELPIGRDVEEATIEAVAEETIRRTRTGGSEFDSRPVRSPGDFVHAAVTVPFRPFPTEGHNRQAQLAGLEGVLLLGLILISLPRLARLPRAILRQPFVALAAAYTVGFIIAFSNVGNFGILTRQRAQLLPFLFVLLAFSTGSQLVGRQRRPVLVPTTLEQQAASHAVLVPHVSVGLTPDPAGSEDSPSADDGLELVVELPAMPTRPPPPPPE